MNEEKNMSEITLVTAYFNIGREKWDGFSRGDEQYISYFKHWARLKNNLIVYTTSEIADKVNQIREHFGLLEKTHVVCIDDVFSVKPELYQAIKHVMKNKESWLFHKWLDHPESWNYRYNYVTGLKAFWCYDAVERKLADGMVAWIDFGYDHGGMDFPYSEDFAFQWEYDFSENIHIFLAKKLDEKPIFGIVRDMDTYIRGGIIVAPAQMWTLIWKEFRRAIQSLADCGLADDDQTLLLMTYRKYPKLFCSHMTSYWGEPLREYGGSSLRRRTPKQKRFNTFHVLNRRFRNYRKEQLKFWSMKLDIRRRKGEKIEKEYFLEK